MLMTIMPNIIGKKTVLPIFYFKWYIFEKNITFLFLQKLSKTYNKPYMKTVILAGGLGTRLSELTHEIPKPMVEIGGYPIIWHIMQIYAAQGFTDLSLL